MDDLLIRFLNEILKGNIPIIIISIITSLVVIIYLIIQLIHTISKHIESNYNNNSVEINLILDLVRDLQTNLNNFIKDVNRNFELNDDLINEKIDNLEKELVNSVEMLENKIQILVNSQPNIISQTINNHTDKSLNKLEHIITNDLIDIRLQRKELKENLNNNILDVKRKIEIFQDLLKSNDSSFNKIINTLDSIKHSLDISTLINSSINFPSLNRNNDDSNS